MQTNLKAQEYVPFPVSNVDWKIYWIPYPPGEPWTAKHYDYITSGDTLINDIQYTKLLKVDYNLYCSDIADTNYTGAYRNDITNKIVYIYKENEEKILYNFSLGIGDTIPTSYFIETFGEEMVVCNIDSIQLENGTYRKQFTYEFPFSGETCFYNVVEGIGFLGGLLEPMSTYAEFINSILLCHHVADSLYYVNPWWEVWGYNECEIPEDTCIISNLNSERYLNNTIEIVPNPISSTAIVYFSNPMQIKTKYSLTFYNLIGEEIIIYPNIKHGESIINSKVSKAGIYIYILKQNNIIVQTGKIIINS